ncbi:hypothetical protein FALBO_10964 [Fusarium albosuccineum]|uniref:Uncharacterized protein n=1 Tax=Fusarium albosuccineum TaxID=1237068 RepID=A0A8H4L6R9_9HYPO|nr:hypothetical protein FALBO_10964 [Fusarium albosuccineum]
MPSSPSKLNSSPEIDRHRVRYGKKCPICSARIVDRRGALQRHIDRHAKLKEIQAANNEIDPSRLKDPGFDVALARDMYMSTPAKHRFSGGVFITGPLAGKGTFEGMPQVFLQNGRVKKPLFWIKKGLEPKRQPLGVRLHTNVPATPADESTDESAAAERTSDKE